MAAWLLAWLGPCLAQTPADCPPAAQAPTPEQVQAGMKAARDRGFLWRIRKDGHSSYLYGTLHVGKVDWIYPGPRVMAALRASDDIALELDLLDPQVMQQLRDGMAPRSDRAVPAPLAERLAQQLSAACLPGELLTAMSPEMLATTLTVMAARKEGFDPAYAIDLTLASLGRTLKKPVISLETPQQQIDLLQGRTPQESRAIVEQSLDEIDSGRAAPMLGRMAQVWADGRFDELAHYAQWCACLDTDEERALYKRLLDDRNPSMAERIDALHMGGQRVFAAVGSLHMIGPLGLPALMARRGYSVERLTLR